MRLSSILIAIFCFTMAFQPGKAPERYSVFKFSGQVVIQKDGKGGWVEASKRMGLNLADICRISEGSSISVLDKETNRVFAVKEAGTFDIKTLIANAEAASRHITARMNDALVSDLIQEHRPIPTYAVLGATARDNGDEEAPLVVPSMTDTVYFALKQCVDELFAGKVHPCAEGLTVEKESTEEGEFCFVVLNRTHELYYFNILRLNYKSRSVSFCIPPQDSAAEVFIPDMMYLKLDQYPFAEGQGDECSYLLFATSRQIDFMALNDMFSGNASIMDLGPLPSIDLKLVEVR